MIFDDREHQGNLDFQQKMDFAITFLRRDCDEAQDHAEQIEMQVSQHSSREDLRQREVITNEYMRNLSCE